VAGVGAVVLEATNGATGVSLGSGVGALFFSISSATAAASTLGKPWPIFTGAAGAVEAGFEGCAGVVVTEEPD